MIGNDGANEFYEGINIVDAPACQTERLAVPTIEALISSGANLWLRNFGASSKNRR
jgi:hypothetical protein